MAKCRLMPCNSLVICILISVRGMFDPWSRQLVVSWPSLAESKALRLTLTLDKRKHMLKCFPHTCPHCHIYKKKVQRCPPLWQQHPNFRDFSHGVRLSDGVCHVRKITVCCEGADARDVQAVWLSRTWRQMDFASAQLYSWNSSESQCQHVCSKDSIWKKWCTASASEYAAAIWTEVSFHQLTHQLWFVLSGSQCI